MTVKQCQMVNNTCQKSPDFALNYDGYTTESLSSDITASGLQTALNNLPSITSSGTVSVTMGTADIEERVYRVKFMFTEPEATATLLDASVSRGQFVSVVLDKAGIRTSKGFSLSLEGVKSLPIHGNNTEEEMTKVMEDLFTTRCTFSARFGK